MRTSYGFWWQTPQGPRMPLQRDVTRNGLPDTTLVISELALDGPVAADELAMLSSAGGGGSVGGAPDLSASAIDLAPGTTLIQGAWNVTVVEQQDGIVVIEAPISSAYSARVIDWATARYPGKRIKAVISTSDSWPHVAGVREYVARGIPVYCLDLNVGQIRRILDNPHKALPDALSATPRRPVLRTITGRTAIGAGSNRIELYPIRGETSERQLMAYLAGRHLLYGSDAFQKGPDGRLFHRQTVGELVQAARREGLAPVRFYIMHVGSTPWGDAVAAADKHAP